MTPRASGYRWWAQWAPRPAATTQPAARPPRPTPTAPGTTHSYDGAGRLTTITHTGPSGTLASFSYTPDAAGNPLSVEEQMSLVPGGTLGYAYDRLGRLRNRFQEAEAACLRAVALAPEGEYYLLLGRMATKAGRGR